MSTSACSRWRQITKWNAATRKGNFAGESSECDLIRTSDSLRPNRLTRLSTTKCKNILWDDSYSLLWFHYHTNFNSLSQSCKVFTRILCFRFKFPVHGIIEAWGWNWLKVTLFNDQRLESFCNILLIWVYSQGFSISNDRFSLSQAAQSIFEELYLRKGSELTPFFSLILFSWSPPFITGFYLPCPWDTLPLTAFRVLGPLKSSPVHIYPFSLTVPNVTWFYVPLPTLLNVSPLNASHFFGLYPSLYLCNQTPSIDCGTFPSIIWHLDGFLRLWQIAFLNMSPHHSLHFSLKVYTGHWLWKLSGLLSGNSLIMGLSKDLGVVFLC